MKNIIINTMPQETRIAITEDDIFTDFLIERTLERGIVGNIYKGKVARVLPGMQAAFVDIGLDKAAFLHGSDISTAPVDLSPLVPGTEDEIVFDRAKPVSHRRIPIEHQLSPGQEILVQAAKDPLGMKGARVTSQISLPGRYLVFMPTMTHVAVSRRIANEKERERLKNIVQPFISEKGGFILRTACEGRNKREILSDLRFLKKLWQGIYKKSDSVTAPSLIHQDLDLTARAIRDFFTADTQRVVVDDAKEYRQILDFVSRFMPRLKSKITLYSEPEPIMDHFGLEDKIHKTLEPKIWLRSGGYILIEKTEALTAVDVNTGRYVGKKNQEETVLKINLEATQEIVRQLRLRNIGGIIIIDFIDMGKASNRKKVYEALKEAIKKDKAKNNILQISELGLVEMTRQRSRENLENVLMTTCPSCDGRGRIKSHVTIAYEVLRAVKKQKTNPEDGHRIVVRVHPEIANFLYDEANQSLDSLEREMKNKIIIKATENLPQAQYEISAV
jgi:ribonuclease G